MNDRSLIYIAYPMAQENPLIKESVKQIAAGLRESNFDVYVPDEFVKLSWLHNIASCEKVAHLVWELDRTMIMRADGLIAFAGQPSTGVGIEIGIAWQRNIPILVLSTGDNDIVSELLIGMFLTEEHVFHGVLGETIGLEGIVKLFKRKDQSI